ncbi:MAG: phosphocholine cytidylyltransferase family protein [Myxococcales bacterium]
MTTLIILAAGQGTRLRPLTDDRPKCMVALAGRSLLEWQVAAAREAGAKRIVVVRGYCKEAVRSPDVTFVDNPHFERTNMVYSLWCARKHFGDGCVVSYGDIVYEPSVLRAVLAVRTTPAVIVDLAWRSYWEQRFSDPLADAETLRLDEQGRITEIGKRPRTLDEVQGQYIGMSSWMENASSLLRSVLDEAASGAQLHPQRAFESLFITDLLQALIDRGQTLHAAPIRGGWLEIDGPDDLRLAETFVHAEGGRLRIAR